MSHRWQRVAQADAEAIEIVHSLWRDWRRYLDIHLELLDLQQAQYRRQGADPFERVVDDPATRQRTLERQLAALPPDARRTFDRVRQQRIQDVQTAAEAALRANAAGAAPSTLDRNALTRLALQELRDEAEGVAGAVTAPGWGRVPLPNGEIREVDVAALQGIASGAVYSLKQAEADDRRRRLLGIAGLLAAGVLTLALWFLWPQGSGRSLLAANLVPQANGTAVTPWPLRALRLETITTTLTLPLAEHAQTTWPPAGDSRASRAFWRAPQTLPLLLCLPAEALLPLRTLTLLSSGDHPARRYQVQPTAPARPDLVIVACHGDTPPRYGIFAGLEDLPPQEIGKPLAASTLGSLAVTQVQVRGPGDDPQLPSNQARVTIHVHTSRALDWAPLAPTLLLESGVQGTAGETTAVEGGSLLSYLVPLPAVPTSAEWRLTLPDQSVRRWQLTLDPPASRRAVVTRALDVRAVQSRLLGRERVLQITLTLVNQTAAPLQLTDADLVLTQGEQPLTLPANAALRAPLQPNEARPLTLRVPGDPTGQGVLLTIGSTRLRID